jgi:hypothetical protein
MQTCFKCWMEIPLPASICPFCRSEINPPAAYDIHAHVSFGQAFGALAIMLAMWVGGFTLLFYTFNPLLRLLGVLCEHWFYTALAVIVGFLVLSVVVTAPDNTTKPKTPPDDLS